MDISPHHLNVVDVRCSQTLPPVKSTVIFYVKILILKSCQVFGKLKVMDCSSQNELQRCIFCDPFYSTRYLNIEQK